MAYLYYKLAYRQRAEGAGGSRWGHGRHLPEEQCWMRALCDIWEVRERAATAEQEPKDKEGGKPIWHTLLLSVCLSPVSHTGNARLPVHTCSTQHSLYTQPPPLREYYRCTALISDGRAVQSAAIIFKPYFCGLYLPKISNGYKTSRYYNIHLKKILEVSLRQAKPGQASRTRGERVSGKIFNSERWFK